MIDIDDALLSLLKKKHLEQGGSLEDFEELVSVWRSIAYSRKIIAEHFGDKQLHLIADCCEFLLRNLTSLEQQKILEDLQERLKDRGVRDKQILEKWMTEREGGK